MTDSTAPGVVLAFPSIPVAPKVNLGEAPPPLVRKKLTRKERELSRVASIDHLVECFADPITLRMSLTVPHEHDGNGGRHTDFPAWVFLGMLAGISAMGSLSEVQACLNSPRIWRMVCSEVETAARDLGLTEILDHPRHGITLLQAKPHGPSRGQFHYFRDTRLAPENLGAIQDALTKHIVGRIQSFHMANPDEDHRFNRLHRSRCLIIDGKVTNSPHRGMNYRLVDRETGEITTVIGSRDTARGLYGEGGEEGMAWGSKWVNAIVADTLPNIRLGLPATYIPHGKGHSEAEHFVNRVAALSLIFGDGIDAVIADGAFNGVHIEEIQSTYGILVVSPPKSASKRTMRVTDPLTKTGYLAKVLPIDRKHPASRWACRGRGLMAAGGTVWTTVTNAAGRAHHTPVTRGQIKRQKVGTRYTFSIHLTIDQCPHCQSTHTWWESLSKKKSDGASFNRAHYLRAYTPLDPEEWQRVYGMRPDVESNNNQIERAWYGQRIPAWGVHNQSLIMLGFALATAAKARTVYYRFVASQQPQVA
jgi:hypothetical protein